MALYHTEHLVYEMVNHVIGADDDSPLRDGSMCCLCGNHAATHVSTPCMHASTCDVCFYIFDALRMQCRECRSPDQ